MKLRYVVIWAIALVVLGVVGTRTFESSAHARTTSTIACYVALSNDITPFIKTGARDVAADASECACPG